MSNFSDDKVLEAIERREAEKAAARKPKDAPAFSFKGMLGAKTAPGAAARRGDYLKYVDQRNSDGKKAVSYEEWADGRE